MVLLKCSAQIIVAANFDVSLLTLHHALNTRREHLHRKQPGDHLHTWLKSTIRDGRVLSDCVEKVG
jgi:hypothetical protein